MWFGHLANSQGNFKTMISAALAFVVLLQGSPSELKDVVLAPDPTTAWSRKSSDQDVNLKLTSQTWKGGAWTHEVVIIGFDRASTKDAAVLYITGDGPDPKEIDQLRRLSTQAGLPVVILNNVPNQPINGQREDELIASTIEKYMESGDHTWPLLFPMTKSAIACMDMAEAWSAEEGRPIKRFVVAGASKRGWTTWLTAATGDKRVIGFAPMVFDMLSSHSCFVLATRLCQRPGRLE